MAKQPTHAGMVCFNRVGQVLICNAKGKPDEWVLPKGHIEEGEESYEAAQRETLEECGIRSITDGTEPLFITGFELLAEDGSTLSEVIIEWWTGLADRVADTPAERNSKWVSWGRALKMLTFQDQIDVVKKALAFR